MNKKYMFNEDRKYSLNRIIRLLTGFPEDKPLPCRYEHGHTPSDDKPVNDLKTKKRLMLVYNKRRLDIWQRYSKKKAVIIGSPFVKYRRLKNICRVQEPRGTVFFPFHSTVSVEGVFDREGYCRKLCELPSDFYPIKICVHEHDIQRGFDNIYREQGFEVVTAGVRERHDFVDKFYEILRHCKYTSSNAFGSYLFYAVEMGIPFFIYGPEPHGRHFNRKGIPGEPMYIKDHEYGEYIENLFSTYPNVKITEEQRVAVEREVGVKDAIDPKELYQLLMNNYRRQRVEDAIRFPFRHPKKFIQRLFSRKQTV